LTGLILTGTIFYLSPNRRKKSKLMRFVPAVGARPIFGWISEIQKGGIMAEEMKLGCARPTGGPVGELIDEIPAAPQAAVKEVTRMIQVGKKVPDFVAPAYQGGKFVSVKLSEYLGKWVLLCFYPGDFTFV
jgi:hypothetical protein